VLAPFDGTSLGEAALLAAAERAAQTAPAELRARGIVPTPLPVARYALERVDALLQSELDLPQGLASERLAVVDPAVGTGVWLAALLALTRQRGSRACLLGIDTDLAALSVVRALLSAEAARQGATLALRCANTLELAEVFSDEPRPRVIVGNPPWSARSLSRGGALSDRWLQDFRRDHAGASLGERRSGVLSDDYVRFFRWTLEQARTAPAGAVVCLATNASYLDGPVHRGMRAALAEAFDLLEVLDLGGNLLLSGRAARDDNVFGVRVGAAITCAVRHPRARHAAPRTSEVRFARVHGSRADKLAALAAPLARTTHAPSPPWFHFRPHAVDAGLGFSLAEAFPFHREGVQTNRDALATAHARDELELRLDAIEAGALTLARLPHFDPEQVRRALQRARERGVARIERLAYRPFDTRWFVTVAPLCHRSRPELRAAMSHSTRCLLAVRKDRGGAAFNLFGTARAVADACFLSTRSSCRTRVFPSHTPAGEENLSPALRDELGRRVGRPVSSGELIAYTLCVLGSPAYRARHEAALKLDYARLPWPRDAASFARALELGEALAAALESGPEPTLSDELEAHPTSRRAPALGDVPSSALACDPAHDDPAGVVARTWEDTRPVPLAQLTFDGANLRHRGQVLVHAVAPAWWQAQVGHHRLVTACLGPMVTPAALLAALSRARRWVWLEAQADLLTHHLTEA
jgi:hypothetical protein